MKLSCVLLFYVLFNFANHAQATIIEAFGDSLTAGMLSYTNVENAPPLTDVSRILSDFAKYAITKNPVHIEPHERRDIAWPKQLSNITTLGSEVLSYAVSGAKTKELITQVQKATSDSPTLSFFFIGHNDLCKNTKSPDEIAQEYKSNFEWALTQWHITHSDSTAVFIPVGKMYRAYQVLEHVIWHRPVGNVTYSCKDSWQKLFPYCPSYYHMQKEGQLEAFLRPRIEAMNTALDALANEWENKGLKNHFRYLKEVYSATDYEPGFFAVDCFHLSQNGQQALAQAIAREL
ncbi:MAG: hypothetical protein HY537_08835 [Deltaproteobacteria bacterium]|nr:hypothetical protein [Deltaproteobacteria bacterium]